MHMKRVMFTTGDRPFELVETYYRADKYHYSVNLVRVKLQGQVDVEDGGRNLRADTSHVRVRRRTSRRTA